MSSGRGGPTHSVFELPEVDRAPSPVRDREWHEHFDPKVRARRLHDYLCRKAANGQGEYPSPLALKPAA